MLSWGSGYAALFRLGHLGLRGSRGQTPAQQLCYEVVLGVYRWFAGGFAGLQTGRCLWGVLSQLC